jgi:hypothetical protein
MQRGIFTANSLSRKANAACDDPQFDSNRKSNCWCVVLTPIGAIRFNFHERFRLQRKNLNE